MSPRVTLYSIVEQVFVVAIMKLGTAIPPLPILPAPTGKGDIRMAKKDNVYVVKVYAEAGAQAQEKAWEKWTKGKRAVVRAVAIGGAVKAVMPHRDTEKEVRAYVDTRGHVCLQLGTSKKVEAKAYAGRRLLAKGNASLVKTYANQVSYHTGADVTVKELD